MIQALYDKWKEEDLAVLTINADNPASVSRFMQDGNYSFPVLLDANEEVMRLYKLQYYPTTFFIDREGIIRDKVIGSFPSLDSVEGRLKKIMSEL